MCSGLLNVNPLILSKSCVSCNQRQTQYGQKVPTRRPELCIQLSRSLE